MRAAQGSYQRAIFITFLPRDTKSSARIVDPQAIAATRRLAGSLPPDNFRVEPLERVSFPENFADVVIASAVLHFARDEDHFNAMLQGNRGFETERPAPLPPRIVD